MDSIICPGCGIKLPSKGLKAPAGYNSSGECYELYQQLSFHTLSQPYTEFIHQLIVDTYGAQHTGPGTKNIRTVFSLIGLCLVTEYNFSGRQVQKVHMMLPKQEWPKLNPPAQMASINVSDVMAANDIEKEPVIKQWVKSVWDSWHSYHSYIRELVEPYTKMNL